MRIVFIVGLGLISAFFAGFVSDFLQPQYFVNDKDAAAFLVFLAFLIIYIVTYRILFKWVYPKLGKFMFNENQSFLRKKEFKIDEHGIYELCDISEFYSSWQGVDRIKRTKDHMFVFVDLSQAFIIPLRGFESSQATNVFCDQAISFWNSAKDKPVTPRSHS